MAETPYRMPPTTLASLYAGKRVNIEMIGDGENTLMITGDFVEIIQDGGMSWIVLRDTHYYTESGVQWKTGEKDEYEHDVKTNKITSDQTCIDAGKVICINRNFDPLKQKK